MKSTALTWKIYSRLKRSKAKWIIVKHINTSRFGAQSLRSLGPKIWRSLPSNIKSETKFKEYIKTWLGPKCRRKVCINMWTENVLLFLCIHIYQVFTYTSSYLYFLKILARIWFVFMHALYFFIFIYMQIYFFPRINKAFIHLSNRFHKEA